MAGSSFYKTIAAARGDAPELQDCIEKTVNNLVAESTSTARPGILLGKIQSGDLSWKKDVPLPVAELIEAKQLFGFKQG